MNWKNNGLVLLGAVLGGFAGFVSFKWLLTQGLYGLLLPGGMLGMGAGLFRTPSKVIAVLCGALALFVGLFAEWNVSPFLKDASLPYFLSHFYDLPPFTLLMIALGAAIGFWIPFRRGQEATLSD